MKVPKAEKDLASFSGYLNLLKKVRRKVDAKGGVEAQRRAHLRH
jgi:hypothetical protein